MDRINLILAALVLAGLSAAAGYAFGLHVKQLAWDRAAAQRKAADAAADLKHEMRIHATDLAMEPIDVQTHVDLVQIQAAEPEHLEETRHALATAPDLHAAVLPAGLVRLRREQAARSAAIAAAGSDSGHDAAVQATGP